MNAIQKCVAVTVVAVLSLSGCSIPTIAGGGGSQGGGQSGGGEQAPVAEEPSGPDAPAPVIPDPAIPSVPDIGQLPASFPSSAVPLVDGDVVVAVELGTGWTVILDVADSRVAFAEASGALATAGFTAIVEQSGAEGSVGSYSSDRYDVQVTASDGGANGPTITYVVTTR